MKLISYNVMYYIMYYSTNLVHGRDDGLAALPGPRGSSRRQLEQICSIG